MTPVTCGGKLRAAEWVVRDADPASSRGLVVSHHYAKGASNTWVYLHGLFFKGMPDLFGVAWWLPPTRVAAESVNKDDWRRVLSLSRLVIAPGVPANAASFLLGRSVRLIKQVGRFSTLLTYADEAQGHTGAIYKAANWHYVGRTKPSVRWVDPTTGRQVSPKATTTRTKTEMYASGFVQLAPSCKHKFVLHL